MTIKQYELGVKVSLGVKTCDSKKLNDFYHTTFKTFRLYIVLLALATGYFFQFPCYADDAYPAFPEFSVLATFPNQHAAVIWPDQSLTTLSIGDRIEESQTEVVDIFSDRIVFRQKAFDNNKPSRLLWVYEVESTEQLSRVVSLSRDTSPRTLLLQPSLQTVPISSSPKQ